MCRTDRKISGRKGRALGNGSHLMREEGFLIRIRDWRESGVRPVDMPAQSEEEKRPPRKAA